MVVPARRGQAEESNGKKKSRKGKKKAGKRSEKEGFLRNLAIIVICSVLFVMVAMTVVSNFVSLPILQLPKKAVTAVFTPVQRLFAGVTDRVVEYLRTLKIRGNLEYEYDQLLIRLDELATEVAVNEELRRTADAFAASGKIVEVNTGGISRGWIDDAYPSPFFRDLLRERGVRFILSSDAHSATALDCAFDRFAAAEDYVDSPRPSHRKS